VIEMKQKIVAQPEFCQDELVTWHDYQGMKCIPVPGVVVRQESESVLIRTRVEGLLKELSVNPTQLAHR
jgi:hypothetical protein